MRFYDISINDSSGKQVKHWTSHPQGNGQPPDPGALKIELDAFQGPQHDPLPGTFVRIWGISLSDIGSAADLVNHDLVIKGGMGKGLPLANPAQAGILIQGMIQQSFANWIGTTMTLDLIVVAGSVAAGTGAAQNFAVNWPAGQLMATMLQGLFGALFPGADLSTSISSVLKNTYHEEHFAGTWAQFAEYLNEQSRRIMNSGPALAGQWNTPNNALSTYQGVQVVLDGSAIEVSDGTTAKKAKQISINDLVGQPTWIQPQTIQATLVMRGDLKVDDYIQLPPTRLIITSASMSVASSQRESVLFQGVFRVNRIHHVGNYKDPGALSWVTVVDAYVSQTDALGQAAAFVDKAAQAIVDSTPTAAPTGADAGLGAQQQLAPSASLTIPPTLSETLAQQQASDRPTAGSVGLTQSAPAPSLGQSIAVGQQFNPGM